MRDLCLNPFGTGNNFKQAEAKAIRAKERS